MSKLTDLQELKETMRLGGGQDLIDIQHKKGKLTARERLKLLFDEDSFVETDAFMIHRCTNFGMEKQHFAGDGVVTGYGTVDGRLVCAYAQDFTVLGGSLGEVHAQKIANIQEKALKCGAPVVGMNDSGGARIQEGVNALSGYGKIFYNNTQSSGVIPQISVIMGPCAGGAVYSPAITDYIFMVEGTSQMFITGPAVIKTVTGEEVTSEELGGAASHSTQSGVAHFSDSSDEAAIAHVRELLSYIPSNNTQNPPQYETEDDVNRMLPELADLVPASTNRAYDMYDVIRAVADDGQIFDVSAGFAKNIITCYIRIGGSTVGVVANQPKYFAGCLDIDGSDKAARFVRLCDAFNVPILVLEDVPGFLPGTQQEHGGIIRHGAKLLYAFCEASVPKVTVILRKAYGGAYIGMSCKETGADFVFAWPGAEIAVMGADGAANIVFGAEIKNADDPEALKKEKIQEYNDRFSNPYRAAEMGYVDDVIDPASTRQRVAAAFDMLASKRESRPYKKHGNIPL